MGSRASSRKRRWTRDTHSPTKYRVSRRPSPTPSTPIALGARSVGHFCLPPHYALDVLVRDYLQIIWGIRGTGAQVIGGRELLIQPNQVAIYFPGQEHRVYSKANPWEFRWWTMDGPIAESIASEFQLVPGVYDATPPPLRLFRALEKAIRNPTPDGERTASAIAYQLLCCAAAGAPPTIRGTCVEKVLRAVNTQWKDPNFSVKVLAGELGIHRSRLSREFRRVVGAPLMAYVLRLRIQEAYSLLRATDRPVNEIALRCGFTDAAYFSRVMRQKFKAPPSQLRRTH